MNVELKALLDLVFDGESLVVQLVAKANFMVLLPQIFKILSMDVPPAVSNWSDLAAEIAALPGSAQEADLIAYIEQKFAGAYDNAKAQLILADILSLLQAAAKLGFDLKK